MISKNLDDERKENWNLIPDLFKETSKLAFAVLTAYVCEVLVQQMNTIRTETETICWIIQVQQAYY